MVIDYTVWGAGGVAGGSGLSEPGYNGWWREGWDCGREVFWGCDLRGRYFVVFSISRVFGSNGAMHTSPG